MDERRLERLLRDAVGDPPEPSFTVDDVTAASRRVTARRRALVAGVAAAVVLAGSAVGVVASVTAGEPPMSTALAPEEASGWISEKTSPEGQPDGDPERDHSAPGGPGAQTFSEGPPKQGGGTSGEDGPWAEGTSGCDMVDRELATALAGELPIRPIGDAKPSPHCVSVARSAAFPVEGGTVSVLVLPRGVAVQPAIWPEGSVVGNAHTAGEETVLVISVPAGDGGTAPLADTVDDVATALARSFAGR